MLLLNALTVQLKAEAALKCPQSSLIQGGKQIHLVITFRKVQGWNRIHESTYSDS